MNLILFLFSKAHILIGKICRKFVIYDLPIHESEQKLMELIDQNPNFSISLSITSIKKVNIETFYQQLDSKGTIVPFLSRLCFAELLLLWVLCYTGTHGHQQLHLMHNFVPICIYKSVGVSLFVFSTFISFFQKHTYLQCKVLRYGMLQNVTDGQCQLLILI